MHIPGRHARSLSHLRVEEQREADSDRAVRAHVPDGFPYRVGKPAFRIHRHGQIDEEAGSESQLCLVDAQSCGAPPEKDDRGRSCSIGDVKGSVASGVLHLLDEVVHTLEQARCVVGTQRLDLVTITELHGLERHRAQFEPLACPFAA